MANEHVLLREVALPVSFTCADGTGILKGTVLQLTDPNTVSAAVEVNSVAAGVAAQEKIADSGTPRIAVYDRGDFKATLSGPATVGDPLGINHANLLYTLSGITNLSGQVCIGVAKETGTNTQSIRYELKPQVIDSV